MTTSYSVSAQTGSIFNPSDTHESFSSHDNPPQTGRFYLWFCNSTTGTISSGTGSNSNPTRKYCAADV